MATTQMNMRIDASLKASGDLGIREGGSTPSAIVRSVWEYAARNRHKPQAIGDLLGFLAGDGPASHEAAEDAANASEEAELQVLSGPRLVNECLAKMGIDLSSLQPMSYEEARAAAFDDDWEEALTA